MIPPNVVPPPASLIGADQLAEAQFVRAMLSAMDWAAVALLFATGPARVNGLPVIV